LQDFATITSANGFVNYIIYFFVVTKVKKHLKLNNSFDLFEISGDGGNVYNLWKYI